MTRRRCKGLLTAAAVAAILFASAVGLQAVEKLFFSIATGGTGGVWYPLGGAIGGVVGQKVPNTEATSEATTAAIDNLKLLIADRAGMAFCYDYHVGWMNDGKVEGITGKHNVRLVLGFYEQPFHIATFEDTGIKSVMDLKGKRVSTGAPNSGTEEQADYVLKALGINWDKDFTREKLGATQSVGALKDNKIHAFFWSGAVPTSSIIDLATTPGLKMVMLPVDGEIAARIMKGNPGVFHKTAFMKGSYSGIESDVPAIAITAVLNVMENFSDDRVYQIVSAIFANTKELSAVWKGALNLTPEISVKQLTPDAIPYLHKGAVKFFKEKGALK
jgi:hypothetical protein